MLPDRQEPQERRAGPGRLIGEIAILATLYVLLGRLGLGLAHYHDNATLFWPPTGLALAALITYGRRLWPGVSLGALALSYSVGTQGIVALSIAAGNTLEAFLGALALERVAHFRPTFERVQDVVAFVFIGVLGCTLVSATVGVATLVASGDTLAVDAGLVWLIWWLGDVGGAIVVAPLLLLARFGSPAWRTLIAQPEAWLLAIGVVVSSLLAFSGALPRDWALPAVFIPFPFVVWAGARLGTRGAVLAATSVTLIAIAGSSQRQGPFILEEAHTSLMLLWSYGYVMGMAALTLASAIAQRDLAQRRYRDGEQERLGIERRMHQAQRLDSLGLLAGGIAHDFNNILTVTLGNAALLRDDITEDGEGMARLEKIENATRRAADLCQRLLAYAGRGQTRHAPLSLVDLVEGTCAMVRTSIQKSVKLERPASPAHPTVVGDETLLRQVVMNLVLNAAEAIGEESGTIRIGVSEVTLSDDDTQRLLGAHDPSPGRYAMLEIVDTGCGMDPATLDRIFDPFFTTKPEGRGLGLASAIGIIQGHAGGLEVESDIAEGTRFRVYLPVADREVVELPRPEPRATEPAPGGLILVADDESGIRELVIRILEAEGYQTRSATDGKEALDLYREEAADIDALLLDITMPRMSGLDVLQAVREVDPGIPILLMSGYEAPERDGAPIAADFLRKPFGRRELLHAIARAIDDEPGARV